MQSCSRAAPDIGSLLCWPLRLFRSPSCQLWKGSGDASTFSLASPRWSWGPRLPVMIAFVYSSDLADHPSEISSHPSFLSPSLRVSAWILIFPRFLFTEMERYIHLWGASVHTCTYRWIYNRSYTLEGTSPLLKSSEFAEKCIYRHVIQDETEASPPFRGIETPTLGNLSRHLRASFAHEFHLDLIVFRRAESSKYRMATVWRRSLLCAPWTTPILSGKYTKKFPRTSRRLTTANAREFKAHSIVMVD